MNTVSLSGWNLALFDAVGARRHTDLVVWQRASEIRERTRRLTAAGGFGRHPWLAPQLSRASQSACANIAEGFARYQPRDFARFLRVAKGSLLEVKEHLEHAHQVGLTDDTTLAELSSLVHRGVAAATKLIRYLEGAKAP
jgi:four helix bundle protein